MGTIFFIVILKICGLVQSLLMLGICTSKYTEVTFIYCLIILVYFKKPDIQYNMYKAL